MRLVVETYDGLIAIMGPANTKALSLVAPAKMALNQRAMGEITRIFMRRHSVGELRWVGTLFPTNAAAQDAEMGLSEFEDLVYDAFPISRTRSGTGGASPPGSSGWSTGSAAGRRSASSVPKPTFA